MRSNKKIVWIILLIFGLIPFILLIVGGFNAAFNGFSGLCFFSCENYYGMAALIDYVLLFSFIYWPAYVVGLLFIVLSIIRLKKLNRCI